MSDPKPGPGSPPPEDPSPGEDPIDDLDPTPIQRFVLRQATRRTIVTILAHAPGLNKHQLTERVEVTRRTLDDHLRVLTWADLVVVEDGERGRERVCFLERDAHLFEDEDKRLLYGQAPTRWVAVLLVEREPATTVEIGEALDRSTSTVREHLARLRDNGLARKLRTEGNVLHFATDALRDWVEAWGEGYRKPWREGD